VQASRRRRPGPENPIRPIASRPYGLKFLSGKNLRSESWYVRIFLPRKFFREIFFGSKVEKSENFPVESKKKKKKLARKLEKKVLVIQLTHFYGVNPAIRTRHRDQKNPDFFLPRNLKNQKNFRSKVEKRKKIWTEISPAGFFSV
jgi:hypothetical protein